MTENVLGFEFKGCLLFLAFFKLTWIFILNEDFKSRMVLNVTIK